MKGHRYQIIRVYVVSCRDCNEDIGRPVTGEDVTTKAEVDELVKNHEEVFHPSGTERLSGDRD